MTTAPRGSTRAVTTAAVAAALTLVAGCSGGTGDDDPIRIAHIGDYSGDWSFYDVPIRDGLQMAVEEINANGGVLDRDIELITADTGGDQAEAVRGVEEALDDGAVYITGTTASGPWGAQASVACGEGVPISTGDGTSPTLVPSAGDCAYHLLMLDTVQAGATAQYAVDELGYESAYVLGSSDDAYTEGLAAYFADAFTENGGQVVAEEEFRIGASDFNVQVTNIAALDPAPDVIFTSMFTPDTPQFLRQLRGAGVDIPVISGDGSVDSSVLEAGDAAEGLVATYHAWPSEENQVAEFLETFEDPNPSSSPQNIVTAVGYDEAYLVAQAIEAAGEADPEAIAEELDNIEFSGVTGSLQMDPETHQADKAVTLIEVTDGQYEFIETLLPDYVPSAG
ncbi:ABC transporter substrate-binding protein [Ornithinimicrobium sp. W1665]|uniref:ABC transporter substrate-binding protein n=1 Tax=Ornithinimicrobium sp. W1665 TaxID=3416666 RepID=UPI003CFBB403